MQVAGIVVWWLLITIFGLIATPLTMWIFRSLPDRGYTFSKPLGLLGVGLLTWLLGHLHFSNATILISLLMLAVISAWTWKKHEREFRSFLSEQSGYILIVELFFVLLFILFLAFRMFNPDILGTEKFMDMAFLHAITRADAFPPYDPWLSGPGFTISYYYFGYLLMAIVTKLSGVVPAVAFNLSLALLFALSGLSVFGLLYNLARRYWVGFLGWAFIFLLGSLDGLRQVLGTKTLDNFNWWTPSRVIPDTINEFPFFSFLLGDMHPHMLAVPFVLLGLALALNHLRSPEPGMAPNTPERFARYGIWGVCLGALGFLNSWDLPMVFFVAGMSLVLQQHRQRISLAALPWTDLLQALGVILMFAVIPYVPFYAGFHSQAKGLGVTTQNTRIFDFLLINGALVFLALSFVIGRYHAWFVALVAPAKPAAEKKEANYCPNCGAPRRIGKRFCGQCGSALALMPDVADNLTLTSGPLEEVPQGLRKFWLFLLQPATALRRGDSSSPAAWFLAAAALVAAAWFFKSPFLAASLAVLLAVGPLLATRVERTETQFALLLVFTAALLAFGADVLHINDTFDPPLDRMNTVFKFYYQIWYLLGIGGAYGLYWLWTRSLRHPNWRALWTAPLVLLAAGSLLYSYAGAMIKTNGFNNLPTLDGSAYLRNSYAADLAGIEWLRVNARGIPVVLEATGGEYTDFARVSTFTGLPTVLGWGGHELQWRGNYDEPAKRIPDIDTLYTSMDLARVNELLQAYHIEYVFVGTLERNKYPEAGLEKFGQIMDLVYENPGGVRIYRRPK